jgi:hypothetical protein
VELQRILKKASKKIKKSSALFLTFSKKNSTHKKASKMEGSKGGCDHFITF